MLSLKRILTLSTVTLCFLGNMFAEGLYFYCDSNRKITQYFADDMKFAKPADEFKGQDIVEVLSLPTPEKDKVLEAFNAATDKKNIEHVRYEFDKKIYEATIMPLNSIQYGNGYFVAIHETQDYFVGPNGKQGYSDDSDELSL